MTRFAALFLIFSTPAAAEVPEILNVEMSKSGMGWRFDVTLEHPDTGWDHYADGWEITDAEGNRLAYRELMHPHVNEQPFTRSLTGVMLPDGARVVYIRSRCSLGGWGHEPFEVKLER